MLICGSWWFLVVLGSSLRFLVVFGGSGWFLDVLVGSWRFLVVLGGS